mmetsp:Transcript_394/g.1081  ORF Transcript_394/g.1081 Transcript_394/m.1081 type:complete len:298 (-) Transcript_394:1170-2063(-)
MISPSTTTTIPTPSITWRRTSPSRSSSPRRIGDTRSSWISSGCSTAYRQTFSRAYRRPMRSKQRRRPRPSNPKASSIGSSSKTTLTAIRRCESCWNVPWTSFHLRMSTAHRLPNRITPNAAGRNATWVWKSSRNDSSMLRTIDRASCTLRTTTMVTMPNCSTNSARSNVWEPGLSDTSAKSNTNDAASMRPREKSKSCSRAGLPTAPTPWTWAPSDFTPDYSPRSRTSDSTSTAGRPIPRRISWSSSSTMSAIWNLWRRTAPRCTCITSSPRSGPTTECCRRTRLIPKLTWPSKCSC